jgi:Winged helix-turn-helix DNA-binding
MNSQTRATPLTANDFLGRSIQPNVDLGPQLNRKRIVQAVKASPDGISTTDVARVVGLSIPTARRILAELEKEREVYSRSHTDRRILIWYPNGKIVHQYLELQKEIRGKTYRVTVQEGRSGPAVQIQERTFSLLDGERVEGAIFIDYESIDDLFVLLGELKRRYESYESSRKV